jgi:hypothetical protein
MAATKNNIDLIEVSLREKIPLARKCNYLTYSVRLPSDEFTKYGRNSRGNGGQELVFDTRALREP